MSSNPIQRKTRNSFLAGMLIMLLIAIIAIAALYFVVFKDATKGMKGIKTGGTINTYRLIADVKSGEEISSKVETVKMYSNEVPTDCISNANDIVSCKSKIDLKAGTVLSKSMLYKNEPIANSARLMEYNMLTLPSKLRIGDYIDVRLTMESGQDYIVLAKKQVMNLQNSTVTLYLTEDEILMMSSAIIESYIMKASNLYVDQYIQAGTQKAATPTYAVNAEVYQLIMSNSQKGINIEDYAKINDSYNTNLRAIIDEELGQYADIKAQNVQEGIETQKKNAMDLYLSGLSGY